MNIIKILKTLGKFVRFQIVKQANLINIEYSIEIEIKKIIFNIYIIKVTFMSFKKALDFRLFENIFI